MLPVIDPCQSQPQVLMGEKSLACLPYIKTFSKSGYDNDWEFQPFTLVNGHDANEVFIFIDQWECSDFPTPVYR